MLHFASTSDGALLTMDPLTGIYLIGVHCVCMCVCFWYASVHVCAHGPMHAYVHSHMQMVRINFLSI